MECFLTKKIDVREAICALEQKINEIVAAYNEVAADQTEINKLVKELKAQVDYLLGAGLTTEIEKVLEKYGKGLILSSPNGTRYEISVSDEGELITKKVL